MISWLRSLTSQPSESEVEGMRTPADQLCTQYQAPAEMVPGSPPSTSVTMPSLQLSTPPQSPAATTTSSPADSQAELSPLLTVALQQLRLRQSSSQDLGSSPVGGSTPASTQDGFASSPSRRRSGSSSGFGQGMERSAKRRSLGSGGPVRE
mmetsp:Transcript_20173/g.47019  ORF Transcript_20173/g.47019 Transcript_20173/m.47019 type:complete len:151 (+) Transcript_20173:83-535(+)